MLLYNYVLFIILFVVSVVLMSVQYCYVMFILYVRQAWTSSEQAQTTQLCNSFLLV